MNQNSDTINVRPDEAIDKKKIKNYLKDKLIGADQDLEIRQFPGGKANLTYLLHYTNNQYVLRRPPLGPIPSGAHDMDREYSVLSVLHDEFNMAPRAFLYEDNIQIIGAPFFVMERKEGIVIRKKMPDEYRSHPNVGLEVSDAIIKSLVELHQVNYEKIGLKKLGDTEGYIERQVHGWYKRWMAAKHKEIQDVEKIYSWLCINMPKSHQSSLVHNDYKLDNVMFSFNKPDMIAVFDWDMCTLGDPLSDLGSLLSYWTDPSDPGFYKKLSTMPTEEVFSTRDGLIKKYAELSNIDVDNIKFYHVLGLFRLIGIIAQIYMRYLIGQTHDNRFERFGDAIPLIALFALDISIN